MTSLWGKEKIQVVTTPKKILDEQANELKGYSNDLLYGDVVSFTPTKTISPLEVNCERDFNYAFIIKSKYIEEYSYKVLSIHHNIKLFPLYLILNDDFKESIKDDIASEGFPLNKTGLGEPFGSISINNEEDMIKVLRIILQSYLMKNILSSLISLAESNLNISK